MAKLLEKIQIEVQSMDKVETLISLLSKYENELPAELLESLKTLADCDSCEIGNSEFLSKLKKDRFTVISDGVTVGGVVSINKVLKRLTVYPKAYYENKKPVVSNSLCGFDTSYAYPLRLVVVDMDGNKMMGW